MTLLTQPAELTSAKPISCLIYGQPGVGKTTVALSAEKPVLIDLDRGLYRVEKRFQCPSLQVESYQQILDLLKSGELAPFGTIVIDTLGKLVDRIGDYVASINPKLKQGDGTLSMKGWGAVKTQFQVLLKNIYALNKSVIFVAHEREDKDGETRFVRPDVSGSAGKDIVKELDLMGYMEMRGNERTISFSPCEKYYAKNALHLPSVIKVPDTAAGNTFFQSVIVPAIIARQKEQAELLEKYNALKASIDETVAGAQDAGSLNAAYEAVKGMEVIWDSKIYGWHQISDAAKKLGLAYDKTAGKFIKQGTE